jgi:hypothetical protein
MDTKAKKPSEAGTIPPERAGRDERKPDTGEMGDSLQFSRRRFIGTVAAIGGAIGGAALAS